MGHTWGTDSKEEGAHANSRFTAPACQCPSIDPNWEAPEGVPVSAILFGGRRSDTVPLVYQALDWAHGVYMGECLSVPVHAQLRSAHSYFNCDIWSVRTNVTVYICVSRATYLLSLAAGATLMSEVTAAALDVKDRIRNDPFAMKPFIGYNVGDYLQHWLHVGTAATKPEALPKIFMVNWFRKRGEGQFLWPGFGDNVRVLEWILDRCSAAGVLPTVETPVGFIPDVTNGGLNVSGMNLPAGTLEALFTIDTNAWLQESKR